MNRMMVRGKVHRVSGNMKAEWGRLTHNDRRLLDGEIEQMLGLLQERYGYTRERAADLLTHYLGGHAKKQRSLPTQIPQSRFLLGVATSLAGLAVIGWLTFTKLFAGHAPRFSSETGKTIDAADGQGEPGEAEIVFEGYGAALD